MIFVIAIRSALRRLAVSKGVGSLWRGSESNMPMLSILNVRPSQYPVWQHEFDVARRLWLLDMDELAEQ
jgi:hypothetical protein